MKIDRALLRASWHSWIANDFRAPSGPGWLQWLWTLIFCAVLAVAFMLVGFFASASGRDAWRDPAVWAHLYGRNLVVCLTVGLLIHLMFDALRRWVPAVQQAPRWPTWKRALVFAGVPMLGVAIGWPLGVRLAGGDVGAWLDSREGANLVALSMLLSLTITFVLYHFFAAKSRQLEAERRATEAQLRLLQGQIEPHFLFNTLATVQALMDSDLPRARRMLESFTDYLRSSLGSLRRDDATLGDELDLVGAYLDLMKTRMDDRLRYEIVADIALREVRLPALALQPLVENAIHHGLEPKREGGTVRVQARAEGDTLVVEVDDDGLGLAAPPRRRKGAGVALANLRERLAALHGERARVALEDRHPGTRATLRMPLHRPA